MGKPKRKGKIKVKQSVKLAAIRGRNNAGVVGRSPMLSNAGAVIRVKIKNK